MPPSPSAPTRFPISVKGVVLTPDGRVLLLENDRAEWELPGGRIEIGETPEQCVAREMFEETRWKVRTGPLLDTWMYYIDAADEHVFIVTYGCLSEICAAPVLSDEHKGVGLFAPSEVEELRIPAGYRRSIATWIGDPRREQHARCNA